MSEQKYRLYADRTTKVPEGVEYSLIPCGASYMLCFTDKPLKEPFREIPEGTKLAEQEAKWLLATKLTINGKFVQEHKEDYAQILNDFCDKLEDELNKERNTDQPK